MFILNSIILLNLMNIYLIQGQFFHFLKFKQIFLILLQEVLNVFYIIFSTHKKQKFFIFFGSKISILKNHFKLKFLFILIFK